MKCLFRYSSFSITCRFASYKNTLNNPKFNLHNKPPYSCDASDIYNKINEFKLYYPTKGKFIIEDGPPYANGSPHVGHSLNKILKDIIRCQKFLEGYDVEFIPGWDCHGLPIELASLGNNSNASTEIIRKNAFKTACRFIEIQQKGFQKWGVYGDWEKRYATFDKSYQYRQLIAFKIMSEKNLIFRDFKPIFWSPSSRTALAESELEYNENHISNCAYVKFILKSSKFNNIISGNYPINLVIWTTTPWTLIANEAVGVSPDMRYVLCRLKNEYLLVGEFCVNQISHISSTDIEVVAVITGNDLIGQQYVAPITLSELTNNQLKPIISINYVSSDKGTGLVHIAPHYGREDYEAMLEFPEIKQKQVLVDEMGCFADVCGPSLKGLSVLNEGSTKILELLGNQLLHQHQYKHSYPYDWRTKKPIIIRLSSQWFIDVNKLSNKAQEEFSKVTVYPSNFKSYMSSFISNRPDWCISRQRKWGVPIPVLYRQSDDQNDAAVLDAEFIEFIANRVKEEGCDFWWSESIDKIVSDYFLDKWNCSIEELSKCTDIFDIWFDSGLSWWCRRDEKDMNNIPIQTDIYLEGIDQFRGWFSTSLLTGVALQGASPYKTLVTHGFVVDDQGQKMSKSIGNVVDPVDVINKYGVDILRFWVCNSGLGMTSSIGNESLSKLVPRYAKIRNCYRFLLGILSHQITSIDRIMQVNKNTDQSLIAHHMSQVYEQLEPIDRFILHVLHNQYVQKITDCYNEYKFDNVINLLEDMFNKISNFYITSIKDRLYNDNTSIPRYQSARITFNLLIHSSLPLLTPIFPCLTNDILESLNLDQSDRPNLDWPINFSSSWNDKELFECVENDVLNGLKRQIDSLIPESMKNRPRTELGIGLIGQENNGKVDMIVKLNNNTVGQAERFSSLVELLRCSWVRIERGVTSSGTLWDVQVVSKDMKKCERCKRVVLDLEGDLCDRCGSVLNIEL